MKVMSIIVGILIFLLSIFIIATVVLQRGTRKGLSGAIAGGADSFLSKNKARTADEKLPVITKYAAIAFLVLAIAANFLN